MTAENIFTIALTDTERRQLAAAHALMVEKLVNAKPVLENIPNRNPPTTTAARAADHPVAASSAQGASPALRDYWVRDRKGNELPNPEGSYELTAHLWKVEESKTRDKNIDVIKITFESPTGKGHIDAKCFDMNLLPHLKRQNGKKTTMHLVKNGQYLNLVGVRA